MPTQGERSHRFNLMLSVEEHEMLTEMAGALGLSGADVLRQLLRRAHRDEHAAPTVVGKVAASPTRRRRSS